MNNVDDLYFFFDKTLRELKLNMTNLHFPAEVLPFDCGSILELFIRRCIFSFSTLMFEDLQKLFENFLLYKHGEEY